MSSFNLGRTFVPPDSLRTFAVSPDGRWLAGTGFDGKLHGWDATTFEPVASHRIGKRPNALAFSADGATLAAGASTVTTFSTTTWKKVTTVKGHRREVGRAAFSPDGTRLYAGGHSDVSPADASVRAWDLASGQEVARWEGVSNVSSLAVSPDGQTVAVGTTAGWLMLLDAATLTPRWADPPEIRTSVLRYTPAGQLLGTWNSALLFEIDGATRSARTIAPALRFGVDLALSEDGATAFVAVGHGGDPEGSLVVAVDVATGATLATHRLGTAVPRGIGALPDGRVVVAQDFPKLVVELDP